MYKRMLLAGIAFVIAALGAGNIQAQSDQQKDNLNVLALPDPARDSGNPAQAEDGKVTLRLISEHQSLVPGQPTTVGVLFTVPKGSNTYYRTPGTGTPTKVSFDLPEGYEVGPVQFPVPEVKYQDIGDDAIVSYMYVRDTVVFASLTPPKDLEPGQAVEISAKVRYAYCVGATCLPPRTETVKLSIPVAAAGAEVEASEAATLIARAKSAQPTPAENAKYLRLSAQVGQDKLRPGDTAQLAVVVDVDPGHHIQMNRPTIPSFISTDLIVDDVPGIKSFPLPKYPPPQQPTNPAILETFGNLKEYHGQLVIHLPIVAKDSLEGPTVRFTGLLHYQACTDQGNCFRPEWASFSLTVPVGKKGEQISKSKSAVFAAAAPAAKDLVGPGDPRPESIGVLDRVKFVEQESEKGSLLTYMWWAFLGGLILNIMPCVLPVIAIKVLGFVQQAGESRSRIFLLNAAYALGVMSVFLILATLAVGLDYGWGALFQHTNFNLVMAGLVFAMGLSLIGVFEIPIPGFAASSGGRREGLPGAFLTGILATLLATPCSGPFLGVTLGWSVQQPWYVTYLVWAVMGFGMASPYIVFGLFPAAIKLLPKPGNWMVRFKEIAGFVLLGTVVYIMTYIDATYTLPTLVMLIGLALGFWMIGNLYDATSKIRHKMVVRVTAVALSGGICIFAFTVMLGVAKSRMDRFAVRRAEALMQAPGQSGTFAGAEKNDGELPWQPFSDGVINEVLASRKTVLVDFTADWCPTCKLNEARALNTTATRELVNDYGIVTLYADFTSRSPEIKRWLDKFQSISVPMYLIFPAERPDQPIVLRDFISQTQILDVLKQAGPSADAPQQQAQRQTTRME